MTSSTLTGKSLKPRWFGLTGCNASGKTTICDYLKEKKGFKTSSCCKYTFFHLPSVYIKKGKHVD